MEMLRKYIWLWVIIGIIFVSVVISLIFIFINKCISRRGKLRLSQLQKSSGFNNESNKYQERESSVPPLPPRTQFLTAEAQSYENLAEVPDYQQALPDYEETVNDYEQALPDYEWNMDEQLDYVKVDDEKEIVPPFPQYMDPDPAGDNSSTEDYDDIGDEAENQEEDYDDVA